MCAAENGAPLSPMTSETKRSVGMYNYSLPLDFHSLLSMHWAHSYTLIDG